MLVARSNASQRDCETKQQTLHHYGVSLGLTNHVSHRPEFVEEFVAVGTF